MPSDLRAMKPYRCGHPLLGYGLVGAGAAAYSPAKYGILTQFFDPARLVKANGWLDGSTIVAILLGVVAGGCWRTARCPWPCGA
jgi:MFS family permease